MRKLLKYCVLSLVVILGYSCSNEIENIEIQTPYERPAEYYENLRAYKKTKHELAFGWFGGWSAIGPNKSRYLVSAPDSMDLISIWGKWYDLTDRQREDMRIVQEVKGTKVIFTVFAHTIPVEYYPNGEGDVMDDNIPEGVIERYAKALNDSIVKYNYDGIDFDYEPGFGGVGPLINKSNMERFVREMSKYVGPASGTGKLLCIDGVPGYLNPGLSELFDYGIVQAYYCTSASNLQYRFNQAAAVGWKPEQYIFTEDFERLWTTGGENFRDNEGNYMPSLIGMARFQPEQGKKGGFGSYHMENEYNHNDNVPYKYMRQCIQIANPASK